jgi:hypothetical protein
MINENILRPAIYDRIATGLERKPCLLCNEGFVKNERMIELFSSIYKNRTNYSNRFNLKCFLKVLAMKYPELLKDEFRDNVIKEIVVECVR